VGYRLTIEERRTKNEEGTAEETECEMRNAKFEKLDGRRWEASDVAASAVGEDTGDWSAPTICDIANRMGGKTLNVPSAATVAMSEGIAGPA
jgi:hypothetical protein